MSGKRYRHILRYTGTVLANNYFSIPGVLFKLGVGVQN